ncbi:MAG: LysR family transcriptional regulator [Pseudomonadota bacterium]|nr:LysR family transcriptional regulator [Pseudomonadota bacterium]
MTPEQLRIFVAVAERGHVTRAAEFLGMSQSAASAAIKALETASGVQLFNRVGRAIELSPAGRRFLPEAKAVLERIAEARHVLENASRIIAGSIAIAASQTIASYWLPRRLAAFQDRHPAVRLDVTIGNTRQVENRVLDGNADLGLVEGRTESDILRRTRVDVDRLMLVVADSHPAVAEIAPARPDLAGLRWIVREGGSGTREVLQDLARRMDIPFDSLRIFLVLPSNEAIVQAVEAGAGATIISELVAGRAVAAGSLRHVPLALPEREFAVISHRDRHPTLAQSALRSFLLAGTGAIR